MEETKRRADQSAAKIARYKLALSVMRAVRFFARVFLEIFIFSPTMAFLAAAGIACGAAWAAQWAFPSLREPFASAWSAASGWSSRHETLSETLKASIGLVVLGACLYLNLAWKQKDQSRIEEDLHREIESYSAFDEAHAIAQAAEQGTPIRRSGASKRL